MKPRMARWNAFSEWEVWEFFGMRTTTGQVEFDRICLRGTGLNRV